MVHGYCTKIPRRFKREVYKVKISLYGLKQSPSVWFGRFTKAMKDQDYLQSQDDCTMFIKTFKYGRTLDLFFVCRWYHCDVCWSWRNGWIEKLPSKGIWY